MSMPGNNIPFHCDNTWEFDPSVVLVEGTVSDIFYPGDPNNPLSSSDTDGVIAYRVLVETKRPAGQAPIFPVTAANQLTGDPQFDQVDPIPVGTGVLVGFPEGDRNRGKIVAVDWGYDSALLEGSVNQPVTKWARRGFQAEVDKNGDSILTLRSGGSIKIVDQSGSTILRVLENGNVELGGDSGLEALVTEIAKPLIENHYHYVAVVGPSTTALDPSLASPPVTPPSPPAGAALLDLSPGITTKTKAK